MLVVRLELARKGRPPRRTGPEAACEEELEGGPNAVAPARDCDGRIIAVLSVFGPSYRPAAARFSEIAEHAMESTVVIGCRPTGPRVRAPQT